ncbi:MAG: hypothetical protein Q9202_007597, partial [Teloschistes flavicans]
MGAQTASFEMRKSSFAESKEVTNFYTSHPITLEQRQQPFQQSSKRSSQSHSPARMEHETIDHVERQYHIAEAYHRGELRVEYQQSTEVQRFCLSSRYPAHYPLRATDIPGQPAGDDDAALEAANVPEAENRDASEHPTERGNQMSPLASSREGLRSPPVNSLLDAQLEELAEDRPWPTPLPETRPASVVNHQLDEVEHWQSIDQQTNTTTLSIQVARADMGAASRRASKQARRKREQRKKKQILKSE